MFYAIERVAEARRAELLAEAQRERQARIVFGKRDSIRYRAGKAFVRIGNRLSGEPRRETRLAGAAGEIG